MGRFDRGLSEPAVAGQINVPQRLKPHLKADGYGMAEAMPLSTTKLRAPSDMLPEMEVSVWI